MSGYRFEGVTKAFGNDLILDRLTLQGKTGSFLCVVGKSGVGKSTLLRLLGGFDQADSGRIFVDGAPVEGPKKDRAMVFQSYEQLFPWLPVWENVAFPLRVEGLDRHLRKAKALEALDAVGLAGHEGKFPHQLSGGMKQRAALARAWIAEPKLLLMDEPFGGLDMMTRETLQALLLDLWRKKSWTIVFITHDLREAALLSTDLLILKEGGGWDWLTNPLPYPRDAYSPAFNGWISRIQL
jgi:NitT/TauT family transport system ATP-binding protein